MLGSTDCRLEMWAGIECTVNRVENRYFDQLARSRHDQRPDDIDRLAALSISALRYPLLWERHAVSPDWSWADQQLDRLQRLGIRPIVGLVHHGSGPPHTSLVDSTFATELAAYAAQVAQRYEWVECYTPINEPLTTARFSGLYGHWYPHGRDDHTFVTALLTQCRAVVLAMHAIRQVNPAAKLIQTEDLGQTHAPPRLAEQASFENERRWLSWDLLAGRVDHRHPLRRYLKGAGCTDSELDWFREYPCPPDIFGVNYYVTSERYLDDKIDRYPSSMHGGNGHDRYVDVEAVRVLWDKVSGPEQLLMQVWKRYRRPLAITEAHLGCTREEQVRWLLEMWRAAERARGANVDVRAVTTWSVFGAYDWDSLVTRSTGHYEPGAFDARSEPPRPTAIATIVRDLANGNTPDHPVLVGQGWWRRGLELRAPEPSGFSQAQAGRPLLITGGGRAGRAVARLCALRGLRHVLLSHDQLDICDPQSLASALDEHRPWAVVNAAGYGRVDEAELNPAQCLLANVVGAATLANICSSRSIHLVTFSTDFVFDGKSSQPYREGDSVAPLNAYGRSKAEAERQVLALHPESLVIRTGPIFGPWDEQNFVSRVLRSLRGGAIVHAANDLTVTLSYAPDLINASLDLLIDGERGLWHLSHPEPVTWAELAHAVAADAGLDRTLVREVPSADIGWRAPRPAYSALSSRRGCLLPRLGQGIAHYLRDWLPQS